MIILFTGGSACGKSSYAESVCVQLPLPRFYIAAMKPYGAEGEARIKRHRAMRAGKGFETFECYTGLKELRLPERGTALLECICNLTANEMFDDEGDFHDPFDDVMAGVENLISSCNDLVIITNDVGAEPVNYGEATDSYIRVMGRINAAIAAKADRVIEMVAGIPVVIKDVQQV